jgi:hypothetical protein
MPSEGIGVQMSRRPQMTKRIDLMKRTSAVGIARRKSLPAGARLVIGLAIGLAPFAAVVPSAAQSDTCIEGHVPRLTNPQDHVCVTPQTRAEVIADNQAASRRRAPGQGDACVTGYVWRQANFQDHVCVTEPVRQQTLEDNKLATSRIASASAAAPSAPPARVATSSPDSKAPTKGPVASKTAVVNIEQLASAQLTKLPDDAMVKLKDGRTASLGMLRSEHLARVQRFTNAANLRQTAASMRAATLIQTRATTANAQGRPVKMVPLQPIAGTPADYKSFCNATQASACFYLPPNTHFITNQHPYNSKGQKISAFDADPLIKDPSICQSEDGSMWSLAGPVDCIYTYPLSYTANFDPGPPPPGQPIGAGVTSAQQCDAAFSVTVDPHGAIQINATYPFEFTTGSTAVTCLVFVPSSSSGSCERSSR